MSGCYRTYEAVKLNIDTLPSSQTFTDQFKVYLKNDNILIYKNGFTRNDNALIGYYEAYNYDGTILKVDSIISLDSISAITQYVETTSGGMYFASAMNLFFGVPLTFMAVYCLACPKCCFGSCPTIYVPSDNECILEAELFSKCISRQLEDNDLDMIKYDIPSDGIIKLKITNEALETHYINKFNLIAVTHPSDSKVLQTNDDRITVIKELIPANDATSNSGKNIAELLKSDDEIYFRSEEGKILELRDKPVKDFIEITSDVKATKRQG